EVIALAPNHLSAKAVLALADGTAPKVLSANATAYQLAVIYYPYTALLKDNKRLDRTALPKLITVAARKRMAALRPIAHKDFQPLLADVATFIDAMDDMAGRSAS